MAANHTPTPWYASFAYGNGSAIHIGGMILQGQQCLGSYSGITQFMDAHTLHDNATHIARCVNAHDELVAALESAAAHLQLAYDLHHSDESPMVAITEEIARARAALAKVQA